MSSSMQGMWLGTIVFPAVGSGLAWWLCYQPRRSICIWFAVVCLSALWKFFISVILAYTSPIFGGHTLGGAIGEWFHQSTNGVLPFLDSFPALLLILVSMYYWTVQCFGAEETDAAIKS